jgi:hypothetical protein
MVKRAKRLIAFALALTLLTLPAVAAGGDTHSTLGVYDLNVESGYALTPLKADGSPADRYSGQFDGSVSTVYEGAEKFKLSFSGSADQYVVFLLKDGSVPTESNIAYIDQTGGVTTIEFTLFPYQLESGNYNVYLSGTNFAYTRVANFKVTNSWEEAPYTLGDVNQDESIDALDSLTVLQASVDLISLTSTEFSAADVNVDGRVDALDALAILQKSVGIDAGF